jgi:protein TonB
MFDSSRPPLLHALLLSLLAHAIVLLGVLSVLPVQLDAPAATIKVVFSASAPPVAVKSGVEKETSATASPSPVVRRTNAPQLVVEQSSAAHSIPKSSLVMSTTPAESVVAPSAAVDAPTVHASAQTSAPAMARDGVNADDLRQYRISLAIAARRFKRYPALARERGWEGTAEVTLTVSAHLPEPDVTLLRSSGHAALDRQAQEMMVQAARAAVLPDTLKGRDFRIVLPVQFSLDGNQ